MHMKIWMFAYNSCQHNSRLLNEAQTLAAAGYDVKIIALLDNQTQPAEDRDSFQIIRVKKSHLHGPLSLLKYYRDSWQIVKNGPSDVYHCHDLNTLLLGYLSVRRHGGKLVYDAHELATELSYISGYQKILLKALEKFLIGKVDAVIVPNRYRSEYLAAKYRISPPTVTLNCPPLRRQSTPGRSLREKLGLTDASIPIILYTGGYVAGRGLRNLVQASSCLKHGVVVFLGWGPLEQELRGMVKEKGLAQKVFFLEPVPPDELVDYISSGTLGVVIYQKTSLNNYYAAPNKLYEYIHAGLPVVYSDFPALKDIVDKYDFGCAFDPEEPKSIAAAINFFLNDEHQYAKARENALAAANLFNWELESAKLLEIYRRLDQRSDDRTA
jgi:glycosyltransferase involved in cell wall biosynthesis